MSHHVRSDEGFTLIEILTVLLIAGVLASIAIPGFLGHRDKAHRSALATDLRSVVLAEQTVGVDGIPFTTDVDLLRAAGYRQTVGVSQPVVTLTPAGGFAACVQHDRVGGSLAYRSSDGGYTASDGPCTP